MLIYDYIIFVQLSVNEYVNYKQCLNSLRTALVLCWKYKSVQVAAYSKTWA